MSARAVRYTIASPVSSRAGSRPAARAAIIPWRTPAARANGWWESYLNGLSRVEATTLTAIWRLSTVRSKSGAPSIWANRPVGYALVSVDDGNALTTRGTLQQRSRNCRPCSHRQWSVAGPSAPGLLERAEREVRRRGIREVIIAAVTTNHDALSFYERRGYTPYLTYLDSRPGSEAGPAGRGQR